MTTREATAALLRLFIVTSKLARIQAMAEVSGQALPASFAPLLAEARAMRGMIGVEMQTAAARQRFLSRSERQRGLSRSATTPAPPSSPAGRRQPGQLQV
jgi:hypothetical protein